MLRVEDRRVVWQRTASFLVVLSCTRILLPSWVKVADGTELTKRIAKMSSVFGSRAVGERKTDRAEATSWRGVVYGCPLDGRCMRRRGVISSLLSANSREMTAFIAPSSQTPWPATRSRSSGTETPFSLPRNAMSIASSTRPWSPSMWWDLLLFIFSPIN